MTDDAALLRRYADERSESAFAEFVRRHLSLVYSAAQRRMGGDAHRAADVAQHVFLAAARQARTLAHHRSVSSWLYTATRNAALNLMRDEQRRQKREQAAQFASELTRPETSEVEWPQLRPVLDDAIDELAECDREAVLLRFFEQRPFAEIGRRLQLNENAARMRVERALEKLRTRLGRRGITSTAAALGAALGNQAMVAAPAGLATTITGAALAGAGTAGTATIITTGLFMSKTSTTLAVVAIVAIGSALYFLNQAQHANMVALDATHDRDALRAKIADAERRASQAEQRATALQRDLATAAERKPFSTGLVANAPQPAANSEEMKFYTVPTSSDPAEAKRQLRDRRAQNLDATYLSLFQRLGFTPEQVEQFKALKLDFTEKGSDLFKARAAAAKAENPSIDRAGLQKVFAQANVDIRAQTEAALRDTFGDAIYAEIGSYETTMPVRPIANQLATSLFNSDTPLTPAQAEQLVTVMADLSRNAQGRVNADAMDNLAALSRAETVLSPPQLAIFRQVIAQRMRQQLDDERTLDSASTSATSLRKLGK